MLKSTRILFKEVAAASTKPVRKTSTGIAGLPVHPKPRDALISLYKETLKVLSACPTEATYRAVTEKITNERLQVVERTSSVDEIERNLKSGLIEQVIVQAQDELELAKKMVEWKPWEPLEVKPAENQWKYFN